MALKVALFWTSSLLIFTCQAYSNLSEATESSISDQKDDKSDNIGMYCCLYVVLLGFKVHTILKVSVERHVYVDILRV
jgi:hypothetical protein